MMHQQLSRTAGTLALAFGLCAAGPANSAINFGPAGDDLQNGGFNLMSFGAAGVANVIPLLYVGDFGDTGSAKQFVLGTDLSFDYSIAGIGSSVVTVTYEITNDEFGSGPFDDLRLMVATRAKGEPAALDTAAAVGFGGAPATGQAAQFRIFAFDLAGDSPILQIINADQLNGDNACGAGCYPEMALQWNRASLDSGDTWTVSFQLIDDPSLVAGGRYLQSTSLGASGASLIFGNPVPIPEPGTYALVFAGLGMLALARHRRRPAAA